MQTDCYLSIESPNCTIEKIRVNGGGLSNDVGNFYITADNVTVINCRSTNSNYAGFTCETSADYVTFNACRARAAGWVGFQRNPGGSQYTSRLVGCLRCRCWAAFPGWKKPC